MLKSLIFFAALIGVAGVNYGAGRHLQRLQDERASELARPEKVLVDVKYSAGSRDLVFHFDQVAKDGTTNWQYDVSARMIFQADAPATEIEGRAKKGVINL